MSTTLARVLGSRWFGLVLLAASLAALSLSYVTTARLQAYTRCQVAVNDAIVNAQRARADAATTDREALDKLVTGVLAAQDRSASRAALQAYVDARADADKARADNPIPDPPSHQCR